MDLKRGSPAPELSFTLFLTQCHWLALLRSLPCVPLFPLASSSQRVSWIDTPLLKEDQATTRTRKGSLPLDQLTLLAQKERERTNDMKWKGRAGGPLSEATCS